MSGKELDVGMSADFGVPIFIFIIGFARSVLPYSVNSAIETAFIGRLAIRLDMELWIVIWTLTFTHPLLLFVNCYRALQKSRETR